MKRILFLGAGAVGGFFGARFARAGIDVALAARGAHLEAIRRHGLRIRSVDGDFSVRPRAIEAPEPGFDVTFVCVKSYDTEAAARAWMPTTAVSLQNGIGNEEILAGLLGRENVLGGVAYIGTEVVEPGVIRHDTAGRVIIGELDGCRGGRIEAIGRLFERAEVPCELTDRIDRALWEKMAANAVFNSIAAAHGCSLGQIVTGPLRRTAEAALDELCAVAAACGVEVREKCRNSGFVFSERYPDFRTSTQQDRDRGRPTEVDVLNGAVVRIGREKGIPTPEHEDLLRRLTAPSGDVR